MILVSEADTLYFFWLHFKAVQWGSNYFFPCCWSMYL